MLLVPSVPSTVSQPPAQPRAASWSHVRLGPDPERRQTRASSGQQRRSSWREHRGRRACPTSPGGGAGGSCESLAGAASAVGSPVGRRVPSVGAASVSREAAATPTAVTAAAAHRAAVPRRRRRRVRRPPATARAPSRSVGALRGRCTARSISACRSSPSWTSSSVLVIVVLPFGRGVGSAELRAQGAQRAEAAVLDRRLAQAEVGGGLGDAAVLPEPQHHHRAVDRRRARPSAAIRASRSVGSGSVTRRVPGRRRPAARCCSAAAAPRGTP